jgi:hypothetical protein
VTNIVNWFNSASAPLLARSRDHRTHGIFATLQVNNRLTEGCSAAIVDMLNRGRAPRKGSHATFETRGFTENKRPIPAAATPRRRRIANTSFRDYWLSQYLNMVKVPKIRNIRRSTEFNPVRDLRSPMTEPIFVKNDENN